MREQETYNPPDSAVEALARCLYPTIRSYFESEEGQREFAEWQARQGIQQKPGDVKPSDMLGLAA